jgi:FkbH-like protein
VEVIALPTEPALYAEAVARRRLFEKLTLTEEDRARTQSIQQNIVRQELTASAGSVDEYLLGLNLVVDLFPFDEPNLARIGQLINKTNQFNVTTRRRTEAELRGLMAAGWYTQAMRVSDRLGDSGLTGVLMAVPEGDTLRLDTWLMSCRVLGRRLEEAMFAALVAYARQQGFRRVRCEFIPTAKNAVSQDLFTTLGCTPDGEEGASRFFVWETERLLEIPAVLHCTDRTQSAATVSS